MNITSSERCANLMFYSWKCCEKQIVQWALFTIFPGFARMSCGCLRLLIWLSVILTYIARVRSNCPCMPAQNLFYNYTAVTVCVRNFELAGVQHARGSVVSVASGADTSTCTVLVEVGRAGEQLHTSDRRMCPGVCGSVPIVTLQHTVITLANSTEGFEQLRDHAVTCSMTAQMASRSIKHDSALVGLQPLHQFLFTVADRALLECYEHPRHTHDSTAQIYPNYQLIPRRKVKAVVTWVGSVGNLKLINHQAMMLAEQPYHGNDAVIAWAATDQQYGCTKEESVCIGNNGRFKYLPKSDINFMRWGWGCAQRRPLRALAHVLKLFDPQFIVSLDDDSFLNYPLLMERYGSLIMEKMRVQPLFMGELSGRTGPSGDLTQNGLFVGGAGYVLGQKLLRRLVRTEIHAYGYEVWPGHLQYPAREKQVLALAADAIRTADHIRHLSLLTEGVSLAAEHCPVQNQTTHERSGVHAPVLGRGDASTDQNSCIQSLTPRLSKQKLTSRQSAAHEGTHAVALDDGYKTVPLAVRLVDFCVNVMAAAHTCQHSDHSLGRCLVYGAHATPLALSCHSEEPLPEIRPEMLIGMCQFAPACNTSEQVTCHRYKPMLQGRGANAAIVPVRVTHRKVYYKEYSTLYNPNTTSAYPA